jgi:nitronate monooxygenase
MFLLSNKDMLIACAEAGILGAMPSLNVRTAEGFVEDLRTIRSKTDKPFAINLTIGLTAPERLEADVAACIEHRVPVIITSYGNPTPIVARAKQHGIKVFHDVISLPHAKKAQAAGVDAIIAVAAGAGGHAGTISPFALFPWLAAELQVPIIGAGCISDGRQVAATLALGAQLCYIGTRFIASTECNAAAAYKQMVLDSTPEDIVYTDKISGIHANFLKRTVPDNFTADRSAEGTKRWRDIWSAGHGVGLIHDVKPIGTIVEDLAREAHDTATRLLT